MVASLSVGWKYCKHEMLNYPGNNSKCLYYSQTCEALTKKSITSVCYLFPQGQIHFNSFYLSKRERMN